MKLFTKYSRINIIASVLVFAGGCIVFYFVLNFILVKQLDESLETEQDEFLQYVARRNALPEIVNTEDQQLYIKETASPLPAKDYSSRQLWNELEKKKEWMRQLVFGITLNGKNYAVTVNRSQEETAYLSKLILLIAAAMIALILVAALIINRILLKKLWQPFYSSIAAIGNYKLEKQAVLNLPSTKIDEFTLLNNSLNHMSQRIDKDYKSLKEFTGNAAHEMQTPLAVINSNAESLMQDEDLLRSHHSSILAIEQAASRLSRLNQSLLLLTKIESRRFELIEKVDWRSLIDLRLDEIRELVNGKKIMITTSIEPCVTTFHQHLADILITNLLHNAVRYNVADGKIDIELTASGLTVSNTSALPALDGIKLFDRFYRHPETKADGNGLGLSIVQQICKEAGYKLSYQYGSGLHIFSIEF